LEDLDLVILVIEEWDEFEQIFSSNNINPWEGDDKLVWDRNPIAGYHTPKIGYEAMFYMDLHQIIHGGGRRFGRLEILSNENRSLIGPPRKNSYS